MAVLKKLRQVRLELAKKKLKKTGVNKFSGFTYYNLPDIMPAIVALEEKFGLCSIPCFTNDNATLTIYDVDDDTSTTVEVPMRFSSVKGANETQNLGASITYLTRYLYMSAYAVVENDTFDYSLGENEKKAEELKEVKTKIVAICSKIKDREKLIQTLSENGLEKGNPNTIKSVDKAKEILEVVANLEKEESK